jgi:hypothetical protein
MKTLKMITALLIASSLLFACNNDDAIVTPRYMEFENLFNFLNSNLELYDDSNGKSNNLIILKFEDNNNDMTLNITKDTIRLYGHGSLRENYYTVFFINENLWYIWAGEYSSVFIHKDLVDGKVKLTTTNNNIVLLDMRF